MPPQRGDFKPLSMPHKLKYSGVSAMERGWGEAKHERLNTFPSFHKIPTLE
jgi:hypothetical protein